jgi:hypothetical protein
VKFDFTSGTRVCPSKAGVWLLALGGPVFTGGPEGSGIPPELELEDELLDAEDEPLLALEAELELLDVELDELELLDSPPELLSLPQAASAAARINVTLDFVSPDRPTDLFKRFINTSPTVM